MVKLSSNPTCVLSDADVITNEQAERIAKVLTKHLPGADNVTEAGKILGVDANGDVALVEDKTGSTYTAGEGLTLENGEFSVDNPVPGVSGASQGDVLTVGANGPEWAAVPQELPASLGTAGQVLTVNSGATGVEWATPSGGSGGVVMLDYEETDKNLFNAAVAGMTNGQPVFVTRSYGQTAKTPAIPLTQWITDVNGNVTVTELCFTCVRVQNADNASIAAYVDGFALKKTATRNPDTGTTTNSFTRTTISRALQFSA